jgi:hypothetical protein
MSQVFPDEIMKQFARGRAATLKLRCTCRRFSAMVAFVPWNIGILINYRDGSTRIVEYPHFPKDWSVLMGNGLNRMTTYTLISDGVIIFRVRLLPCRARGLLLALLSREYVRGGIDLLLPTKMQPCSRDDLPACALPLDACFAVHCSVRVPRWNPDGGQTIIIRYDSAAEVFNYYRYRLDR